MPVLRFPDGFLWGSATASYQVEGSPLADGAGASIWHTFAHTPGKIEDGETADVSCDQYNRYREDIELMRGLGLGAYRFSIAWPRVLPEGTGAVNERGLDYYDRLVDALLAAGIEPFPTLYHWDLPEALERRGGWPSPDAPEWFADYTASVLSRLGDRVSRWITFNEPWVFAWLGYGVGFHAPGRADTGAALAAGHNVLLAHGECVGRFREIVPRGEIGITLSVLSCMPASHDPADQAASDRAAAFNNYWFSDPICSGSYPDALYEEFGEAMPAITEEERAIITRPIDFIGLNYYTRNVVECDKDGFLEGRALPREGQTSEMGFEVYPAGLYQVLHEFQNRYRLPLYVTENGAAFDDHTDSDGRVADHDRLRFLQSHFEMAHRAIAEGVDLRGYMVWSLIDNFEWTFGYSKRFGVIACDFETGTRTVKSSGEWLRRVIADNGI